MEGFIYKITNQVNKRIYVGQTKLTIQRRFREHKQSAKDNKKKGYKLYNAMNKYGADKFSIEVIETIQASTISELKSLLNEREMYWIKQYNSYNSGYNSNLGGSALVTGEQAAIKISKSKDRKERGLFDSFYKDIITTKEPTARDIYEANLLNEFSEIDFWIN